MHHAEGPRLEKSESMHCFIFHNVFLTIFIWGICQTEADSKCIGRRMSRLEVPGWRPGGRATRRFMEVKLVGAGEVDAGGKARWRQMIGWGPWRHQLTGGGGGDCTLKQKCSAIFTEQIFSNNRVESEVRPCSFAPLAGVLNLVLKVSPLWCHVSVVVNSLVPALAWSPYFCLL